MNKNKGFTLIELMIVIAIIAVIAAIAIPNLLQATIASNEATAVTQLRSGLATGQATFKKNDWYKVGFKGYANGAKDMFELAFDTTVKPHMIDQALGNAFGTSAGDMISGAASTKIAKSGYLFIDNSLQSDGSVVDLSVPSAPVSDFDYCAIPQKYDKTGRATYVMNLEGSVYGKDTTGTAETVFPTDLSGWISSGS